MRVWIGMWIYCTLITHNWVTATDHGCAQPIIHYNKASLFLYACVSTIPLVMLSVADVPLSLGSQNVTVPQAQKFSANISTPAAFHRWLTPVRISLYHSRMLSHYTLNCCPVNLRNNHFLVWTARKHHMNSIHQIIQFIMKAKRGDHLPFLVIYICLKSEGSSSHKAYHKAAHTTSAQTVTSTTTTTTTNAISMSACYRGA